MKLYIIGHLTPDVDTVCSAVIYSHILKAQNKYTGYEVEALISEKPNKETVFVFEQAGIDLPRCINDVIVEESDKFILVDHNEESQRHQSIKPQSIVEIIDHHKFNLSTAAPITITARPLGSTASILYEIYKPSERVLKLLTLLAILSDTVGLRSSTKTQTDETIALEIAKDLGLTIDKLAFDLFKAKSNIAGLSIKDLCLKDFKVSEIGGVKVLCNQIETVQPEEIIEKKNELIISMREIMEEQHVQQIYTVITDILNIDSKIICTSKDDEKVVEKAFNTKCTDFLADIGPRMSRKKDILPNFEKAILG